MTTTATTTPATTIPGVTLTPVTADGWNVRLGDEQIGALTRLDSGAWRTWRRGARGEHSTVDQAVESLLDQAAT